MSCGYSSIFGVLLPTAMENQRKHKNDICSIGFGCYGF